MSWTINPPGDGGWGVDSFHKPPPPLGRGLSLLKWSVDCCLSVLYAARGGSGRRAELPSRSAVCVLTGGFHGNGSMAASTKSTRRVASWAPNDPADSRRQWSAYADVNSRVLPHYPFSFAPCPFHISILSSLPWIGYRTKSVIIILFGKNISNLALIAYRKASYLLTA